LTELTDETKRRKTMKTTVEPLELLDAMERNCWEAHQALHLLDLLAQVEALGDELFVALVPASSERWGGSTLEVKMAWCEAMFVLEDLEAAYVVLAEES
jgi:hypothetical protein